MTPSNPLEAVRRLAVSLETCEFYKAVAEELPRRKMDSDDLLEILRSEIGETHCYHTASTRKKYPSTMSDYYSFWVDVCGEHMFIKLLIVDFGATSERLVVTSFKKDIRK